MARVEICVKCNRRWKVDAMCDTSSGYLCPGCSGKQEDGNEIHILRPGQEAMSAADREGCRLKWQ